VKFRSFRGRPVNRYPSRELNKLMSEVLMLLGEYPASIAASISVKAPTQGMFRTGYLSFNSFSRDTYNRFCVVFETPRNTLLRFFTS
jgi:hypothetical protein